MIRRSLGPILIVVGVAVGLAGLFGLRALLGVPLQDQHAYLARTLLPLVVGLWCLVGGLYALSRWRDAREIAEVTATSRAERKQDPTAPPGSRIAS